jgi:hypothetical protein
MWENIVPNFDTAVRLNIKAPVHPPAGHHHLCRLGLAPLPEFSSSLRKLPLHLAQRMELKDVVGELLSHHHLIDDGDDRQQAEHPAPKVTALLEVLVASLPLTRLGDDLPGVVRVIPHLQARDRMDLPHGRSPGMVPRMGKIMHEPPCNTDPQLTFAQVLEHR